MAFSKCPHCENRYFELAEQSPSGSNYKIQFVQCSKCGAPVGVMEYYDSGALLKKNEKRLEALEHKLANVEHGVSHIDHVVVANRKRDESELAVKHISESGIPRAMNSRVKLGSIFFAMLDDLQGEHSCIHQQHVTPYGRAFAYKSDTITLLATLRFTQSASAPPVMRLCAFGRFAEAASITSPVGGRCCDWTRPLASPLLVSDRKPRVPVTSGMIVECKELSASSRPPQLQGPGS